MLRTLFLAVAIVMAPPGVSAGAEPLRKRTDAEGNVHYGTASDPYACCMCEQALGYESHAGNTTFLLRHGLTRIVGNERVFVSGDGEAWYCEGTREMGRFGRKCGLVPPLM